MRHGSQIKLNFLCCFVLALLIFLAYSNSFENSFQFDDIHTIVKNPNIKNISNVFRFFSTPETGSGLIKETSGYRPILVASFALNYYFGGLNVFGYHLLNLIIHTLSAFLVYFITLQIFQILLVRKEIESTRTHPAAFFAAALFALLPVQIESVTYITGRSSSLTTLFILGSFWAYVEWRLSEKVLYLALSAFSYVFALLVKETAIIFPLLLILFILFLPFGRSLGKSLYALLPHFVLSMIYLFMRIYFFGSLSYNSEPIRPLHHQILTQLKGWVYNLYILVLPVNLNVDYDLPIARSFFEGPVILSTIVLSALALILWRLTKTIRPIGFFALWFVITLLPTSSLIPLEDVVTDRWLYMPSVGLVIIMALLLERIYATKIVSASRATKIVFFCLCLLAVEIYGVTTLIRNITWTNEWTLWEDAAAKSPNKARPHIGLGVALIRAGLLEKATGEFRKAIALEPKDGRAYLNLGHTLFLQGKWKESIPLFQRSFVLTPRLSPEGHNNLGTVYSKQGDLPAAIHEFQLAIKERPLYANPQYGLGAIYEKAGDLTSATRCMEKAIQIEPEFFMAYEALNRLYLEEGKKKKSRDAERNFIKYSPWPKSHFAGTAHGLL